MIEYLCIKITQLDIIDRPVTDPHKIKFYPFIHNCSKSTVLKKIINDPTVQNSSYLFFMYDKGAGSLKDWDGLMNDYEETNRIIDLLDSHRCPNTFYKSGLLKLI